MNKFYKKTWLQFFYLQISQLIQYVTIRFFVSVIETNKQFLSENDIIFGQCNFG